MSRLPRQYLPHTTEENRLGVQGLVFLEDTRVSSEWYQLIFGKVELQKAKDAGRFDDYGTTFIAKGAFLPLAEEWKS